MKAYLTKMVHPEMITPDMTAQQLFNYVSHFLYKQGEPSVRTNVEGASEVCAYRGPMSAKGQLMCAVGCILPDEIFQETMEGKAVTDIEACNPDYKHYWAWVKKHKSLLCSLQTVHDDLYDHIGAGKSRIRKILLERLSWVAEEHKLEFESKDYKAR